MVCVENNPDANCLCWKLLLLSPHEVNTELPNESASLTAAGAWLRSKLMLVSSADLSIWSTWVPSQSGLDLTCCFSVIKIITTGDQIKSTTVAGVIALIFVLSDHIPIRLQNEHFCDIVRSLPSDSRLPLLIVSSCSNDESEIAKVLGLDELDKSRVIHSFISFFKNGGSEKLHGVFLSDECICKGIHVDHDIENQKSRLENCLIKYLPETNGIMGLALAHKEANSILLQKSMRLELRGTTYYIVLDWVSIFKRIFSWRLMSLTSGEVSSTYILVKHDDLLTLSSEPILWYPKLTRFCFLALLTHPLMSWLSPIMWNMKTTIGTTYGFGLC